MIKECHLCGTRLEEGDFKIEGVCHRCEAKFKELESAHMNKKLTVSNEIGKLYEDINDSLGNCFEWTELDIKDMEMILEHYKAIWARIAFHYDPYAEVV